MTVKKTQSLVKIFETATIIDSMQHAVAPPETTWKKLAWALNRGSWNVAGWHPESFIEHEPTGSNSGMYYLPFLSKGESKGQGIFAGLQCPTFGEKQGGAKRQRSVWLVDAFEEGTEVFGFQLCLEDGSGTSYGLKFRAFVGAAVHPIEERTISLTKNGAFGLARWGKFLYVMIKPTENSPWELLFEAEDLWFNAKATEFYGGVDGNGSNPTLTNFIVGALTEKPKLEEEFLPTLKAGRSYPPDKIGLRLTTPSGQPLRLAEDEHNPNNILSNLRITTEMNGGFKELANVLNRLPQRVWPELQTNSDVEAYLASGKNVFEGYVDKAPNVSGPQASITPTVLGYQSMMEDNQAISIGWTTKNLTKFTEPPTSRKKALIEVNSPNQNAPQINWEVNGQGLNLVIEGAWQSPVIPRVEAWIDAGPGLLIGAITGNFEGILTGGENLSFILQAFINGLVESGDFYTSKTGEFFVISSTGARLAGVVWTYSTSPAGASGFQFTIRLTNVWVRTPNALSLPAYNEGTGATWGFHAKDMLVDLFARKATNGLEARAEDIDDDGFIIQEAWYSERTNIAAIVKELIKYGWYDWFFYNGKRFSYKKPGTYGRTWKTTVASCALNEDGRESTRAYDKCVVQWTNGNGELTNVGPIGSGCTYESTRCETSLPSRTRTKLLIIPSPLSEQIGFEIAERFLEEAALNDTSGSATVTGYIMDEHGYFHPVSEVRSGDYLEPTDAHDRRPRKIVNTSYTHQQRQNQLDLAAPASGMAALLERLEEAAAAAGVGG